MKKAWQMCLIAACVASVLAGCAGKASMNSGVYPEAVNIVLDDGGITVDGQPISQEEAGVYAARDIIFYPEGKDFTFGEGTQADEHSQEEADRHTVVHITQPGTYAVSGKLTAGQIAVDLGENAQEDPAAVVTLILNGVDITCSVAPAVIFYRVYECGDTEQDTATKDVDTAAAGANVIIADGTYNKVNGSYVARIYKSYELNAAGTEVVDSKKLHKYDGAFYSKMSLNVDGGEKGTGVLEINAENEGLDSELHLTINGGNIVITSGNDGINTNEDGVSVTTVNGGSLCITVDGSSGEGDGIDSNGWLVINGGQVNAYACSDSADAGIDSDMGIHINGGIVMAAGNMLDRIGESSQNYAVFSFAVRQKGGETVTLQNDKKKEAGQCTPVNDYSCLILSMPELAAGTYYLEIGGEQMVGLAGNMGFGGFGGGMMPEGERPEPPEGFEKGKMPEGEWKQPPEGFEKGKMPEGEWKQPTGGFGDGRGQQDFGALMELSEVFEIRDGGSYFSMVSEKK